jgi:hypothetical protein
MRIINKATLGFVFLGLSLGTMSSAGATNIVGTGGTIESIVSFSAASSFNDVIWIKGLQGSFPNCTVDSNGFLHARFIRNTDGTNPSADRIFTLALTAYTLGKTVNIQVSDSNTLNGDCQVLYLQLN